LGLANLGVRKLGVRKSNAQKKQLATLLAQIPVEEGGGEAPKPKSAIRACWQAVGYYEIHYRASF
jgi:hypothetical protein